MTIEEHKSKVECSEIVENFGYCLGNAFESVWRVSPQNKKSSAHIARAFSFIKSEIDRRKGFILRGTVLDSYVPDILVERFCKVMEYETGNKGQALTHIFNAHQNLTAVVPLTCAIVHLSEMMKEVSE